MSKKRHRVIHNRVVTSTHSKKKFASESSLYEDYGRRLLRTTNVAKMETCLHILLHCCRLTYRRTQDVLHLLTVGTDNLRIIKHVAKSTVIQICARTSIKHHAVSAYAVDKRCRTKLPGVVICLARSSLLHRFLTRSKTNRQEEKN